MSTKWYDSLPRPSFSRFKKVSTAVKWFEIYEITTNNFIFYEPRHFEEAISNLVIGDDKAVLIDTGCGIGDLYQAVKEITNKPVRVVNTHTHADHLGVLVGWIYLLREGQTPGAPTLDSFKHKWRRHQMRQKLRAVRDEEERKRRDWRDDNNRYH